MLSLLKITPPFVALLFLKVPPLIVTVEPTSYDLFALIKPPLSPLLFSKVPLSIVTSALYT